MRITILVYVQINGFDLLKIACGVLAVVVKCVGADAEVARHEVVNRLTGWSGVPPIHWTRQSHVINLVRRESVISHDWLRGAKPVRVDVVTVRERQRGNGWRYVEEARDHVHRQWVLLKTVIILAAEARQYWQHTVRILDAVTAVREAGDCNPRALTQAERIIAAC